MNLAGLAEIQTQKIASGKKVMESKATKAEQHWHQIPLTSLCSLLLQRTETTSIKGADPGPGQTPSQKCG